MYTPEILTTLAPYCAMDDKSLQGIMQTMQRRSYNPGGILVSNKGRIDHIGIVISGHAQAYVKTSNGEQIAVYTLGHGDFFGDLACLTNEQSIVSVVCRKHLKALVQPYEDFLKAMGNHINFKCHILLSGFEKLWQIYQATGAIYQNINDTPIAGISIPKTVEKAIRFINIHYDQMLDVATVAGVAGMSKSAFSRRFKQALGVSFKTYLNHYRISKAKYFITKEGMNVTEACYAVGFNDTAYFSRTFRRIEGKSPSELKHFTIPATL